MNRFPRVLISGDADVLLGSLPAGSERTIEAADADVVLIEAGTRLPADLPADAGVVVLTGESWDPDTLALLQAAGIEPDGAITPDKPGVVAAAPAPAPAGMLPTATAEPTVADRDAEDLLARVDAEKLLPETTFVLSGDAVPLLRLPGTARVPGAVAAAMAGYQGRRVVALGIGSDPQLLANALAHAARRPSSAAVSTGSATAALPAWHTLKDAVVELRPMQAKDGSIAESHERATALVTTIVDAVAELTPRFPHDADYLDTVIKDLRRWADGGFVIPDFLDSVNAFHPDRDRVDGREHLVLFPMYTQNGNPDRNVEAVLIQVVWPDFIADLEAGDYSNKMFLPIRFLDFTPGYDTNSAVLFPETIAMREVPAFTWGGIFADREAARFRRVVTAAATTTRLALPPDAARLLADQQLAEQTFVMWDLIHDRTHMHGDLPFDPFMIKQRMPYFLYTLEELRCDLTAFREAVRIEATGVNDPGTPGATHARLVQYAIIFDRIFRFAITGARVRNYDGLGGQLLFAWLHQHHVLHWTDNRLTIDWANVAEPVLELGRQIESLYWHSIDRSKIAHWLAAYELVSATVSPNPASVWAKGPQALPLDGPPKGLTDQVLPDEFPLSMFFEALSRKLSPVIESTAGITGAAA